MRSELVVLPLVLLMLISLQPVLIWPSTGHNQRARFLSVDWAHYHDYGELTAILHSLENASPSLAELVALGSSWGNRTIWALVITDERASQEKLGVLVVGYHHARERIALEVPLYIAWRLVADAQADERVAELLRKVVFYVVPALNPDGIDASELNPWHRKNLRPVDDDGDGLIDEDPPEDVDGDGDIAYWWNETGSGFEGIDNDGDGLFNEDWPGGVDLNRNYGFHWGDPSVKSGSTEPFDEDYIGPGPFSEPETRALRDFVLNHTDIKLAISYHSGTACVLYPWAYTHEPCPDEDKLLELAGVYGEAAGYPYKRWEVVTYTCSGEWGDWMYAEAGALALTVEVYGMHSNYTWWEEHVEEVNGTFYLRGIWSYFNPPEERIEEICAANYGALLATVEHALHLIGGAGQRPPETWPIALTGLLAFTGILAVLIVLSLPRGRSAWA